MTETKKDQSGASGSSLKDKADETVKSAKATAKAAGSKKSGNGRRSAKAKRRPQKTADARKTEAARQPQNKVSDPPKAPPKQAAAEKALEEVREIREENEKRAATHSVAVVNRELPTEKGKLTVGTAGGRLYINDNIVLDQEQTITLRQVLDAAFQAVS